MRLRDPPIGLPRLVRVVTFHREREEAPQDGVGEILTQVSSRYGSGCSRANAGLKLKQDHLEIYVEGSEEEDSQTFLVALSPVENKECSSCLPANEIKYEEQIDRVMELLPQTPLSIFDLRLAWAAGRVEAHGLLEGCLDRIQRPLRSMGLLRGCFLVGLDGEESDDFSRPLEREFVLLPFDCDRDQAPRIAWDLCRDVAALAAFAGRLKLLRSRHDLALRQIDASEQST